MLVYLRIVAGNHWHPDTKAYYAAEAYPFVSWKPTKLQNTDATTASTIHQLRLGHGYFSAFLARLPNYSSTQCQCPGRIQSVKHLLLGCRTYRNEREAAGITRETTLHSLIFTSRGTTTLQDFIRSRKVATRGWLLQRGSEDERDDMWGWGRLGGSTIRDREAEGQEQNSS